MVQLDLQVLQAVAEALPMGVVLWKDNGIWLNPFAEEITGYKQEELPDPDIWFLHLDPNHKETVKQVFEAEEPPKTAVVQIRTREGYLKWLEVKTLTLEGTNLTLFADLTQYRLESERFRLAKEKLERRLMQQTEELSNVINLLLSTRHQQLAERAAMENLASQVQLTPEKLLELGQSMTVPVFPEFQILPKSHTEILRQKLHHLKEMLANGAPDAARQQIDDLESLLNGF